MPAYPKPLTDAQKLARAVEEILDGLDALDALTGTGTPLATESFRNARELLTTIRGGLPDGTK